MGNIIRWLVGIVVAAFVTFALFVAMKILISGDFKAQEKLEDATFEINPTVEDIKVVKRTTKIDKVRKVITPPPPPQIERQAAVQPQVPVASLEGAIPDFEPIKLDRKSFTIAVSDKDAQPLVRIPGQMPDRAEKSGHCLMRFDVSPEGAPFNVEAYSCSSNVFKRNSIKATNKFKYNPKILDGRPVAMRGVETKITYRLTDERGKIIPE